MMVTHEMIPAVDSQYLSSLSSAVIDGELRQKLGFQGVVITDSLVMGALNNRWTVAQAAALAIEAGADMVIGPQNAQVVAQVKDALKAAIASGKLSQTRIETSVKRILKLKITMGLLPIPHPTSETTPTVILSLSDQHAEEEHKVTLRNSLICRARISELPSFAPNE